MNEDNLGDVRYVIDHESRIMYTKRCDTLNKKGVCAEWNALQKIEGFEPAYETVIDYSSVPRVDLDISDLVELSKEMQNYDVRTGNIAIVVGLNQDHDLLARLFCTIVNVNAFRNHQVFTTTAEAEVWIFSLR